jgi:hypothetical protein
MPQRAVSVRAVQTESAYFKSNRRGDRKENQRNSQISSGVLQKHYTETSINLAKGVSDPLEDILKGKESPMRSKEKRVHLQIVGFSHKSSTYSQNSQRKKKEAKKKETAATADSYALAA